MPSWAAAATRKNKIELQPLPLLKQRRILETTLRHELAHAFIDALGNGQTPRWLAEGMALYLAGEGKLFKPTKPTSVANIEQTITDAAARVRSEINTRMDMRIVGLARLAQRWEDTGASSQSQWEAEATLNLRHFPGYYSIAWVEPSLRIRWLVSRETSHSLGDLRTVFSQYD